MSWLSNIFRFKKTIDQQLKANYIYYANLNITLEQEWQQDENLALLLLEETGVGG